MIVVDDGSPRSAAEETKNLLFDGHLQLTVIRQENAGVAASRNSGLDKVAHDTTLIAFLDSDDIWPEGHLERAICAFNNGVDLVFSDSRRSGHYKSYIRERAGSTYNFVLGRPTTDNFNMIPPDTLIGLMSKEFPAQISTVVYKACIAPGLRFETRLRAAGEDLLFLCMLLTDASRVAFDRKNCVECGRGLNMYYGISWDNPKYVDICVDEVLARRWLEKTLYLSAPSRRNNSEAIRLFKKRLARQMARSMIKFPNRVPNAVARLAKNDPATLMFLPLTVAKGGLTLLMRKIAQISSTALSGARKFPSGGR